VARRTNELRARAGVGEGRQRSRQQHQQHTATTSTAIGKAVEGFKTGSRVRARFKGGPSTYPGVVQQVHSDGESVI
jgi:hypothetical protein